MKYVKYVALSEIGNVRTNNEDYYLIFKSNDDSFSIFLVADGMGGHNAGEVASSLACKYVLEYLLINLKRFNEIAKEVIKEAYSYANQKITELQVENPLWFGMGTTLAGVFLLKGKVIISNVGDSRVYLINAEKIMQITEDHSLVYEMYKDGKITKEEIYTHPQKNIITRAIGVDKEIEIDIYELTQEELGERWCILLCTDGLTNMVPESYIKGVFTKNTFEKVGEVLINKALENGGVDNITVLYFTA
ncbi:MULTISPECIES: Stp1/IreP family PP2C-type Ser/Thr phosphatase [unclassified Caldicellulosiruptor]|uniref:Stp1/IreP family PP2C-type Ser/Thr phosphatase n=1 Tax=unclassified Caldicellulosiruptor TaxID=2622462 RepID=UPI00058518D7|nr:MULTISPECIES: Stp1/IreP family PP2C-type Ser/Thr phosphatase [unclassified Caldicellulosiruptor]